MLALGAEDTILPPVEIRGPDRVRPVAWGGRRASWTPCICPRELWVCPNAPCIRIGLWPRPGMYWFSRKVPCAGPAGNMPGCAAAGFPMSSGLPVLSPIAAPRCTVVAGCGAGTGAGRGVALCWAARGDWDRVVAAAEGVVMFALPLESLGRICGCFGWMSRGAPEVRGLGLAETTCATPGLDADGDPLPGAPSTVGYTLSLSSRAVAVVRF
ncbi:hypothetical protein MRX96_047909 [Rhipicephalus microplus]